MRRLIPVSIVLVVLGCAFASLSCSEREAGDDPGDLAHRALPSRSELTGSWVTTSSDGFDDAKDRPGALNSSDACREADVLFGDRDGPPRNLAGVSFSSRDTHGLYVYFFAEEVVEDWWLSGYPDQVADYYASSAWGRCYADWLEEQQKSRGASVSEHREEPVLTLENGTSLSWSFHLEGETRELKVEVYAWTEGSLLLMMQVFGSDSDIDRGLVEEATSTFREKARIAVTNQR